MKNIALIAIAILVNIQYNVFAQKSPFKFGKVSKEELLMNKCALDSGAEAAILYDFGVRYFTYNESYGFELVTNREMRIKIFTKEGYDWAEDYIRLYTGGNNDDDLTKIKGYTFNLENGKIVESKLGKESIFKEKETDSWTKVSYTMPDVKEGSVIDISYTTRRARYTLIPRWFFQQTIPVQYSEYIIKIPEWFNYLPLQQGYEAIDIEKSTGNNSITFSYNKNVGSDVVSQKQTQYESVNFRDNITRYVAKNMPSLKPEKYAPKLHNFLTSVEFQMASRQFPGGNFENILGTWDKINQRYLDNDDFGLQLKPKGFYSDFTDPLKESGFSNAQKVQAVYQYISENIKWNGINTDYPNETIRSVFKDRTGDAAGINILLISMLRDLGFVAEPVILSTRANGLVHPEYPILSKYNYLIAEVIVDTKNILMDATQKNLPLGVLPHRCLNQQGRRISAVNPGWVSLVPAVGSKTMIFCNATISEAGELKGSLQMKSGGYSAISIRKDIEKAGVEKYQEKMMEIWAGTELEEFEIKNQEDPYKDIVEKVSFVNSSAVTSAGDVLYVNPLLQSEEEGSPFKNEERALPIDFSYPRDQKRNITFTIPEGYVIEELPESVNFGLPNNAGSYKYYCKANGKQIQLISRFKLNQTLFALNDYSYLRDFFNMMADKESEQIVLKKDYGQGK